MSKENIRIGLLGVIAFVLVLTYLRKPKIANDHTAEIAAKDETIKAVIREREIFREWKDSAVAAANQKETQLVKEYRTTTIKYETIPVYYNIVGRDTLRAAAERWAR